MQFCMLNWPLEATKGQIGGGSLLQIDLYDVYKLCAKFHAFIKKCTKKCLGALLSWLVGRAQSIV